MHVLKVKNKNNNKTELQLLSKVGSFLNRETDSNKKNEKSHLKEFF